MTQRTEAEIVAEIERLRDLFEDHTNENRMMFMHRLSALGWVLSATPSPVSAEIAELRASLAKAEEALERIAELTPMRANAATAHDLHLSIKAIAITALDPVGENP